MDLRARSIEIILEHQMPSGAYLASPNFPTYRYSWFRDGSFIAHAMDMVGEHESARRFHRWVAAVISQREDLVRRAVEKASTGEELAGSDYLHTRYTADGGEADVHDWPNHQLDGFGTWLWSLGEHLPLHGTDPGAITEAADLIVEYLKALWRRPCFDCWEEFPHEIHTYTLAAIYGGLRSHQELANKDHGEALREIRRFIDAKSTRDGHFVKFAGSQLVDASLLGLAVPYGVVGATDARMTETVARIESTLANVGGVRRYLTDTYYGGGEWVLLACWLAWYHLSAGNEERASRVIEWVESKADDSGALPEQVSDNLNDSSFYQRWREQWGEIASPLLWSHAMYLIALEAAAD